MMQRRSVLAVCALLVAAPALAPAVSAQSLGLTPAEIRASFKPGQIVQFDLSVSNDGDTPVAMRTVAMDLWFDPATNEKVFGAPGTLPHSAANWVTFVPPTFTAPAHGTGKVHVTITPPPDAAGGGYAVLFVESKPERAAVRIEDGRAMYANIRLGALVLLSAAGTEVYRLDATNVRLTPPGPNRNLELRVEVANGGNVHLFPEPRIAILDRAKQVVARAAGDTKRLFPGQKDQLSVSWGGTLAPGEYTVVLTLTYGKDQVYTQELPLTIGGASSDERR
jgi:hypothetical protein